MTTTETQVSQTDPKRAWKRMNTDVFTAMKRPRKRRKPPVRWAVGDGYQDRIARAVRREREHQEVRALECDSVADHLFRCVCCGRVRGEQERREPNSEVCMRCVRDAGFWN